MSGGARLERQRIFRQLKPHCIGVLQAAGNIGHQPQARNDLVRALASLCDILQTAADVPLLLDTQLCEYVFVPLSQVLRVSRQVPVRALELCLSSILLLLRAGWGGHLEPALAAQLMILFTFLAKPAVDNGVPVTSEELQCMAIQCTSQLFEEITRTKHGKDALLTAENMPALGETVLVVLDSLTTANAAKMRTSCAAALKSIITAIDDNDALASFLPRLISTLTKVLTPAHNFRPGARTLKLSLNIVCTLFQRLLSDKATRNLPDDGNSGDPEGTRVIRSKPWLRATATQIKIALANILRLRNHDKPEVRCALLALCSCVVQDCLASLSDCIAMVMETMISLVAQDGEGSSTEIQLRTLLLAERTLSDLLREVFYDHVRSLPRLMQSNDDLKRHQGIRTMSVMLRLLDEDSYVTDLDLARGLCDSVSAVFMDSGGLEAPPATITDGMISQDFTVSSSTSLDFAPLKMRYKGQDDLMTEHGTLLSELSKSGVAIRVVHILLQSMDGGAQERRLANFWTTTRLLQAIFTLQPSVDAFLVFESTDLRDDLLDELYSRSVSALSPWNRDVNESWMHSALALETVALQATRHGQDFRMELGEVLYPVLFHIGGANTALRQHALTCLNVLAKSCGYPDAGTMVVDNVDYIVNAVSLRLAVGDVSPQAPQVLLMMMRLCGPSLLPYLDDLIESIFDALERYHGYTRLTELLFSALKGIAEEGAKAPQLMITGIDHNYSRSQLKNNSVDMTRVIEAIKANKEAAERDDTSEQVVTGSFPHQPWTENNTDKLDAKVNLQDESNEQSLEPSQNLSPPIPKTYTLLLKISELTQHYLTTSSPQLRTSLLSLLTTTIPALARLEDSFLPLINTLWPVLLPRLDDQEAYVVANALNTITLMCKHAGNFMSSRVEAAWEQFKKVYRRSQKRTHWEHSNGQSNLLDIGAPKIATGLSRLSLVSAEKQDTYRPEEYVDTPSRMIWTSFVVTMCSIAECVAISEQIFGSMLDMLAPVLMRDDVWKALQLSNADAAWLRLYKMSKVGKISRNDLSVSDGDVFKLPSRVPAGQPNWHFVNV